jgi:hypothetical protein
MLPKWENSQLVMHAERRTGNWIGAASALLHRDYIYLAYRDRQPAGEGRGSRVFVARSPVDSGTQFEVLCVIDKEELDAVSMERPALDVTPGGDWDLYLSCGTSDSKHWRIEKLRADDPAHFRAVTHEVVFPGSAEFGIKDPVVVRNEDLHILAVQHPLAEGDENADRMMSVNARSGEPVMVPEPGTWYSRGTRVTAVVGDYAYFDGRASAAQNFEERTGVAQWAGSRYIAIAGPSSSPFGGGALRYVSAITLPDGSLRLYYESAAERGSHELRTELRAQLDKSGHGQGHGLAHEYQSRTSSDNQTASGTGGPRDRGRQDRGPVWGGAGIVLPMRPPGIKEAASQLPPVQAVGERHVPRLETWPCWRRPGGRTAAWGRNGACTSSPWTGTASRSIIASATRTGAPAATASFRPCPALTVTCWVPAAVASSTRAAAVSERMRARSDIARDIRV